jgi:hypothetical protein
MNQLTAGLIVVIGILGGFYVGARYGQGHPTAAASTTNNSTARNGAGGGLTGAGGTAAGGFAGTGGAGAGGAAAGAATFGTITAVNGDTITIHDTRNNRDVQVNIASARITKTADGTPADLTQNTAVTVIGQTGSDGVVTATTIAIGNVTGGFGGAGGRRGGAPSPSPSTGS